ncbi:hypothetical protein [Fructilactobacillus florum]|uniref:hypothetical protein n=1 Tax=Fructilactobacillus florum TaxID=640331 RepID=UPI0006D27DEE|nr:hypothetical protein [Fructilactobacillus florum]
MKLLHQHRLILIKLLALIIVLGLLILIYESYKPEIKLFLNPNRHQQAVAAIRQHGWSDLILVWLLIFFGTAIPGVPVMLLGILSGLCFGILGGSIVNMTAIGMGNIVTIQLISFFKN